MEYLNFLDFEVLTC